jgi:zinc protease
MFNEEAVEDPSQPPQASQDQIIESIKQSSTSIQSQKIEPRVLENGLEVYAIKMPAVPMVTVMIAVKNGAYVETPDLDGLAHLYEHMFFKANAMVPSQTEFLKMLDELGVELGPNMNAYTSTESVRYFFTVQSKFLEQGITFMADAVRTPQFLQEELEKEREVVIGEFDRYEGSPTQVFYQKDILQRLFSQYFSRKNVIGDRQVILSATPEQMKMIQNRFYIPNNSALFVVGDFDEELLWNAIDRSFNDWNRGPDPFESFPIPDHPPLMQTQTFNKEAAVQNVTIIRAYQGPSVTLNDKDTIAFDLLSQMISLESSPWRKELINSGLAASANFFSWSQRHTSPLFFTLDATPENAQKAYVRMHSLISRMAEGGLFTEEQLKIAKTSTEVRSAYDREIAKRYALGLASIWTSTGSLDYYTNYIDLMKSINLSDIDAALANYLRGAPYIAGALIPPGAPKIVFHKQEMGGL